MKKYLIAILSIIVFMYTISSCGLSTYTPYYSGQYDVSINSFGEIPLYGKSYYITNETLSNELSLEEKEYFSKIKQILRLHGAREESPNSADYLIIPQIGISDPISYDVYIPVPIFGKTGISSITSNATTNLQYGNNGIYGNTQSNTYYNYDYGITGISTIKKQQTEYLRYCNIYIYDNKKKQKHPISKTLIKSIGSSNNIRYLLPYMLSASFMHIGRSSNKIINYKIKDGLQPSIFNIENTNIPELHNNRISIIAIENYNNFTRVYMRAILTGCINFNKNTYIKDNFGKVGKLISYSSQSFIGSNQICGEDFSNNEIYDFYLDFEPVSVSASFYEIYEPDDDDNPSIIFRIPLLTNTNNIHILMNIYGAYQSKMYDKVIAMASDYKDDALQTKEHRDYIYKMLSASYAAKGDTTSYLKVLSEGAELFDNAYYLGNIVNVYALQNKIDDAIKFLEKAIAQKPKNTAFINAMGSLFERKEDYKSAATWYKRILEIEPDNFDGNYNYARGLYNQAVTLLSADKIDKLTQDKAKALYKESLPYFEKAYKMNPSQVYYILSSVYNSLGMQKEYERVIAENK